MAASLGLEPRQNDSESFVLPLHHEAKGVVESRLWTPVVKHFLGRAGESYSEPRRPRVIRIWSFQNHAVTQHAKHEILEWRSSCDLCVANTAAQAKRFKILKERIDLALVAAH